jgi:hypothetical protein
MYLFCFFSGKNNGILHAAKPLSLLSFSVFLRTIAPFFGRVFSTRCKFQIK